MDLSAFRRDYVRGGLGRQDLREIAASGDVQMPDPTAVVVATVDKLGIPSQRTVLLKFYDHNGFVFYTNYGSRKATEIAENPQVSMLFVWLELERQVRIGGVAEKVSAMESAQYIMSRPRESQLSAWVSSQSKPLSSRQALLQKLDEIKRKIGEGKVPIPDFWGGFRVVPQEIEFWQGRANRLHDRFLYVKKGDGWEQPQRLAP